MAQRQVVAEIPVGSPVGIVAAEDGVWVASQWTEYVARIDPATNEYNLLRRATETRYSNSVMPVLADDEVWASMLDAVVVFSRGTDEVVAALDLQNPMDMVALGGLMWVAESESDRNVGDERVLAIDIASREIVRKLSLPGEAPWVDGPIQLPSYTWMAIAAHGESIWVTGKSGLLRLDPGP